AWRRSKCRRWKWRGTSPITPSRPPGTSGTKKASADEVAATTARRRTPVRPIEGRNESAPVLSRGGSRRGAGTDCSCVPPRQSLTQPRVGDAYPPARIHVDERPFRPVDGSGSLPKEVTDENPRRLRLEIRQHQKAG